MIEKIKRPMDDITNDVRNAVKGEKVNVIALGNFLLEAKEQLKHGKWLPWLKANFGSSDSTAQNYMNAARFAAKYPNVGNLKLTSSVLFILSNGTFPLDVIEAIFKVAETELVGPERLYEIINSLHADRHEEQEEDEEAQERGSAAARTEEDAILEGPAPELPPAPEPSPVDLTLQEFDKAVATLFKLNTKPRSSFAATTHGLEVFNTVQQFMAQVAAHHAKTIDGR